jgi:hypothetical protein
MKPAFKQVARFTVPKANHNIGCPSRIDPAPCPSKDGVSHAVCRRDICCAIFFLVPFFNKTAINCTLGGRTVTAP